MYLLILLLKKININLLYGFEYSFIKSNYKISKFFINLLIYKWLVT